MNIEQGNNIESIIITYLSNNASVEEKTFLDKWLAESKENKTQFAQIADIWDVSGLNNTIETDTDAKFSELKTKIKEKSKRTSFVLPLLRYAAVFLLALTIGGIVGYNLLSNNKFSSQHIAENQIIVPKGSKTHMRLPDGSEVWLNSGSKLTYNDDFTSGDNREVTLEGEAFFNVSKNKKKPFLVNANQLKVEVLGTSFNLKSYAEDDIVETTLIEGSVKLIRKSKGMDKVIYLKPNEKATFSPVKKKMKILKIASPEEETPQNTKKHNTLIKPDRLKPKQAEIIESIVSWKDQILVFNSDNLIGIAKKLERWYGYEIVFKDTAELKETYTGKFEHNETITMVLDVIKTTSPIEYEISNNKVVIYNKKE